MVFFTVLQMPALVWVGGWIVIQVLESVSTLGIHGRAGGVAYLAHVEVVPCSSPGSHARMAPVHRLWNEAGAGWFEGPEGPDTESI